MDPSPLTASPELQWSAVLSILLLSIAVPGAIFLGRNNVRSRRRDLVRDLVNLFGFARDAQGNPIIIPSLELVKWKYDPHPRYDPDRIAATGEVPDAVGLISFWYFLLPTSIYILFTCLGFCVSFLPVMSAQHPTPFSLGGWPALTEPERLSLLSTISYTFLGGYIWTIYYLIKRVSNFDLSPLSFLRASAHILFGTFVSAVLWHGINELYRGSDFASGRGIWIALAFLVGFFPELGLSRLLAKYPQMRLKRIGAATTELCEELPLDTIVGIDAYIKFRLGEFEIEDVQNLATVNPIQLFVETPYNLYEILDWVAQAQLIVAVGSAKTLKLREINVRTIFDLEEALRSRSFSATILDILLPAHARIEAATTSPPLAAGPPGRAKDDKIKVLHDRTAQTAPEEADVSATLAAIVGADLHVQRLRQLRDVIAMRLDQRPRGYKKRGEPPVPRRQAAA
jgi:hypothetical protein